MSGGVLSLTDRARSYAQAFPQFQASHLRLVQEQGGPVLYGMWLVGQDYRNKTEYYGAYPHGYLERVMALFPDAPAPPDGQILHVFAGSLPPRPEWLRVDLNPFLEPDLQVDVYDLPTALAGQAFPLVLADPPYDPEDAARYNVAPLDRGRALAAIAGVVPVGGHLVWLDTCWPMHRRVDWRTVGRISLVRSTNHRIRLISIFERVADA